MNKIRFEQKVEKIPEAGCWIWNGSMVKSTGYGLAPRGDKRTCAHRLSYELFVGPIPKNSLVLHHCDVRCCVNPSHLFLGDYRDNHLDMQKKGRTNYTRGETNPASKLTQEKVIAIRKDQRRHREIAKEFGISGSVVSEVKAGKAWAHIPDTREHDEKEIRAIYNRRDGK